MSLASRILALCVLALSPSAFAFAEESLAPYQVLREPRRIHAIPVDSHHGEVIELSTERNQVVPVLRKSYAYGWFGATPHKQSYSQKGYYGTLNRFGFK